MASSKNLVDEVADLVSDIEWSKLPTTTREAAERCTLHVLATTYLGARRDISRRTVAYATTYSPGSSLVIGRGAAATATEAAFANATMCHADFRDDAHAPSQSHPGVTVIPAALAAAEIVGARNLAPGELGAAIVAGYQVIGRLGRLGAIESTNRGFRASAIYSVFGGAVAAARVLGLKGEQLRSAITLAAQNAAGLNQPYFDGTDDWILLPGLAARNGLLSALLAREGIVGAPGNLTGEIGFFRAYADLTSVGELNAPGLPDWEIEVTRLKSVLTCGWNQAPVNAVITSGVALDDVDRIEVDLSTEAYEFPGVTNFGPYSTYTAAVLSLPYAVGSLLSTGRLDTRNYDDVTDSATHEAASRVTIRPDANNHGYDNDVTLILKDGTKRTVHTRAMHPSGC
jgi:2-methylcitrate dehydratase PrpD